MKLLLTSAGFEKNPKIGQKFLELVGKPASEIKVIFVPTAADVEKFKGYLQYDLDKLAKLGIQKSNIKTLRLDHKIRYSEVKNYDVIHMCGGNTFYLLKKVREFGFDKIIKQFLRDGKLYFGISAGSYLTCPTIEAAGWKPADKNMFNLKNLAGLNLVPFLIVAHYLPKYKDIIDKAEASTKYKVVRLTDQQAILVVNGKTELIK